MNDDFDESLGTLNPYYAAFPPSTFSWLYIAIDIRDMGMAKIGLTRKELPQHRIAEGKTYNPFLTLFATYELSKCTHGVSSKELIDIERYIHSRSWTGGRIKHLYTEADSEWFYIHPEDAENQIDWVLAKRGFSVEGKNLYSEYVEPNNFNDINVEYMRKIKTIFRPRPNEFALMALSCGMLDSHYQSYYNYLTEFHSRPVTEKIYL